MTQIGYTILVVESVQESLPFWTKGLGFVLEKPSDVAGYQTLVSSTGQTFALVEASVLEAHTGVAVALPSKEIGQWQNPLFFSVEVDDLDSVLERLKPFEVHLLKAPSLMPWGATVVFVQDSQSGLCFELSQLKAYTIS
ncbi:MAG: VOC family protein [Vampirovibrionales bacterium]|jgi:catechol 2,3-dioxygenase-like lactoylglutathione lyase family enzyme|nr:VOC family protein [Vampirovibrionales bacterium]